MSHGEVVGPEQGRRCKLKRNLRKLGYNKVHCKGVDSQELLGHVVAAAFVEDISTSKDTLESDDAEDEESHAGCGRGDA